DVSPLSVGPLTGGQELRIGRPDPSTGIIPVSIRAESVHFDAVKVVGLACACPHGTADAALHGPGNSGSGFIGCGASGLVNPNVDLGVDHNTTPGEPLNGPGTCAGGSLPGVDSGADSDCGGGTVL